LGGKGGSGHYEGGKAGDLYDLTHGENILLKGVVWEQAILESDRTLFASPALATVMGMENTRGGVGKLRKSLRSWYGETYVRAGHRWSEPEA
jgi:hypothetical protein